MPDTGVDLRDVQIAARHADPRTTMRYDRARKNPGRQPDYILAAYMASGTGPRPSPSGPSPGRRPALPNADVANRANWSGGQRLSDRAQDLLLVGA